MFTVWICIECLHRILKSELLWTKMTVELVSSAETEERSVKKTFCVKITCELQMFSNRDCVMGEYFSCIYF